MLDPSAFIAALIASPPEFVWLLLLLVCFSTIVIMLRLFGKAGLYAYVVVGVIGANLQVLKVVQFSLYADPVALGTILFARPRTCARTSWPSISAGGQRSGRFGWASPVCCCLT